MPTSNIGPTVHKTFTKVSSSPLYAVFQINFRRHFLKSAADFYRPDALPAANPVRSWGLVFLLRHHLLMIANKGNHQASSACERKRLYPASFHLLVFHVLKLWIKHGVRGKMKTMRTNGLGSRAMYSLVADKANTGLEAPPTGLAPVCVFSSCLSFPAFLLGSVLSLSF